LAAGALTSTLVLSFFSLLTGLVSFLAGAAGAVTAAVGVAGLASSFLAGSAAKADTANAKAIKVAINFMLSFLFG